MEVGATDCAGNTATAFMDGPRLEVVQDDNRTLDDFYSDTTPESGPVSYDGPWGVSSCACWSQGTTRHTSTKGASITVTSPYERGQHVGLVMAKGPNRGKAAVFVDGERDATVDTYTRHPTHRIIVWESWMPAGEHTVKVVNLATPGRARIDLDVVVFNR